MFDVSKITLDDIDQEIDHTVDRLERLVKLREAAFEQNQRQVEKLLAEYHAVLRQQAKLK